MLILQMGMEGIALSKNLRNKEQIKTKPSKSKRKLNSQALNTI